MNFQMNKQFYDGLNRGIQNLIKWQYHFGGDFNDALFKTICLADELNMIRLQRGFPEEVEAYRLYTQKSGWWRGIQDGLFQKEAV